MYDDIFIGLITINSEPYLSRAEKALRNITNKLKIPKSKVNVFKFPSKKLKGIEVDIDLLFNHKKVMETALKKNYKYCLIFEDDVDFVKNANKIFNKNLSYAKKIYRNWGILYLGCKTVTPIVKIEHNLYRTLIASETHALLIKDWCMRKVLKRIPKNKKKGSEMLLSFQNNNDKKVPRTIFAIDSPIYFPFCKPIMIYPSIAYQSICCRFDKKFLGKNCNSKKIEDNTNTIYKYSFLLLIILFFVISLILIYIKRYKFLFCLIIAIIIILISFPYNLSMIYLYLNKYSYYIK